VKGKPDIIDIIEKKGLQWYGHVKRMPEERIPKLIMEWTQRREEKEDVEEKRDWKEYKQP
jgi:IS5 family transposase